jgi:hypothetical protein
MSAFVLKDAEVIVNSIDLSDHVLSVTVNYNGELEDATAMGQFARVRLAGLIDWSVDVTFKQDFATANVDDTLFPLVGAAAFPITVMADLTAGVGVNNPRFEGDVVLETYQPIAGAIGELAKSTTSFKSSGDLTRATA